MQLLGVIYISIPLFIIMPAASTVVQSLIYQKIPTVKTSKLPAYYFFNLARRRLVYYKSELVPCSQWSRFLLESNRQYANSHISDYSTGHSKMDF